MRFMHTADWHIGKRLNSFDLLADQQAVFTEIRQIAQEEQVDAVVIAGDVYDRALANEESVHAVNEMIQTLNLTDGLPLLVISGNHDSPVRLGTGSPWFKATQYYLHTTLAQAIDEPIVLGDTQFFLLPFWQPFAARQYFGDEQLTTVPLAMTAIVQAMQAKFVPDKKHVLVAHFFAAGSSQTDSETTSRVGGLDAVPVDLLAPFDYVALGHLHSHQALHEDKVRYSGSPLKFSASEAKDTKGVWIVDTTAGTIDWRPLTPPHDLQAITASFADLTKPDFLPPDQQQDYLAITLTDTEVIPNVMQILRSQYPHILEIQRAHGRDRTADTPSLAVRRHLDPLTLAADFYTEMQESAPTDRQKQWLAETWAEMGAEK